MTIALLTLLHLLIPIYWLGGDLGTYLCGRAVRDTTLSPAERLFALRLLLNVDMAPRTALILTLPTGLTLAAVKGWLPLAGWSLGGAWVAALIWIGIAWAVHLRHDPSGEGFRKADIAIRYAVLASLAGTGAAALAGFAPLPFFIALKLLLLASAIAFGMLVRRQLAPLFPAIAALRAQGASEATNSAITATLQKTTRSVFCIWAIVFIASFIGLATPL